MSARLRRNVIIFVLSTVAGGVFYLTMADRTTWRAQPERPAPPDDVPVRWEIPAFELENAHGGTLGRDDLLGSYWIADLIYTGCPAECPMMTRRMRRLQETLTGETAEADDVRLVSISVDPSNDSAAILRDYASKERADPERWHFLRGDLDEVGRLAREGFRVPWQGDDPRQHSQRLILVDPCGRVRGSYRAVEDAQIERLRLDLAWLREREPAGARDPKNQ